MNAPLSREEYLAVLLAPARQEREQSRALPQECYGDPAAIARLAAEAPKERKAKAPKINKKWR